MPVNMNIGKPKTKQQIEQVAAVETVAAFDPEVDELATLLAWSKKQSEHKNFIRLAELQKKFKDAAMAEDNDADEEVVFKGKEHDYTFGKQSTERKVTAEGVTKFFEKVGQDAFVEVVTVPISALEKYVPKLEQPEYAETKRGSRSAKMAKKTLEA